MFAVWAPTEFRWRTVSIAAMLAWVSHVDSPKNLQPELTTSHGLFRLNLILAFIVVIMMLYFLSSECARVCVDTRRLCPLLSGSAFFPWGQDLSLNPKLGWWPASPNNSPTSFTPDPCTGVATTYKPYLTFYVTSEDLNSDPHASTASAVTHWAVYPAPVFLSEKPIALFLTTSAYSVTRRSQD